MVADNLNIEFVQTFLEEARDLLFDWERHCIAMGNAPTQAICDALFRTAHNLKGSARSVGLERFGKMIHKAEDLITLVRSGKRTFSPEIGRALLDAQALLSDWRDRLTEDPSFVPEAGIAAVEATLAGVSGETVAAPEMASFGFFDEPETPKADAKPVVAPAPVAAPDTPAAAATAPSASAPAASATAAGAPKADGESVRVMTSKIDALMQLVGELAIQQATISHHVKGTSGMSAVCLNAVNISGKLMRDLQRQTMGLRLIGVTRLLQRLERTAKDLAFDQKKPLVVETHGDDVELDKAILDRLTDPLVHIVRNAVDHGIEAAGERSGKAQEARLVIAASQTASGVVIEVSDDGKGMDLERIRKKAVGAGILHEGETYPEARILDCIFAPGFSTAAKVTEVSGRGVGLDVVRRAMDELGGSVGVESRLGSGSRFSLNLPTSVSIVDSLVVLVDDEHYVVPIQEIAEIIDMAAFKVEARTDRSSTIAIRDGALTVRRASDYLPKARSSVRRSQPVTGGASPLGPAMIVEVSGKRVAFAFDRIVAQQPVVIRKISGYLAEIPGFAGSTVLATGEPAIILSPRVFARQFFAQKESA